MCEWSDGKWKETETGWSLREKVNSDREFSKNFKQSTTKSSQFYHSMNSQTHYEYLMHKMTSSINWGISINSTTHACMIWLISYWLWRECMRSVAEVEEKWKFSAWIHSAHIYIHFLQLMIRHHHFLREKKRALKPFKENLLLCENIIFFSAIFHFS